jgi:hypothetical protein
MHGTVCTPQFAALTPAEPAPDAPAPVSSDTHVGLSIIAALGASLIPADARRGPARARSTYRAVA